MDFFLVILASCIFGSNFLFNDRYQRIAGSGLRSSMVNAVIGGVIGIIALLAVNFFMNGMSFSINLFHPAALTIAVFAAVNSIVYTVCSLRAMAIINLSLYSVFAMLGGMALPSVLGMLITSPETGLREPLTLAKAVCFILIILALLFTVQKGESSKGKIYYIGVFVLNGLSGVFSTLMKKFAYTPNQSEMDAISTGYSVAMAVFGIVIAGIVLLLVSRKEKNTVTPAAFWYAASGGGLNRVANFMLVIALTMGMQSSIQFPIVTGVVMIASTLLCYFTPQKPKKKDIISVVFAFFGVIALLFIPI